MEGRECACHGHSEPIPPIQWIPKHFIIALFFWFQTFTLSLTLSFQSPDWTCECVFAMACSKPISPVHWLHEHFITGVTLRKTPYFHTLSPWPSLVHGLSGTAWAMIKNEGAMATGLDTSASNSSVLCLQLCTHGLSRRSLSAILCQKAGSLDKPDASIPRLCQGRWVNRSKRGKMFIQ